MQSIFLYGTPSNQQAKRIQDIVAQRQGELDMIDRDILQVRSILEKLLLTREDIRQSLEEHKSLIIPEPIPAIERLPPELWSQIFQACVDISWTYPEYPRVDLEKAPLLLGYISKQWRDIALSHPPLWSSICISKDTNPAVVPLIDMWLERSGALPLSIEIRGLSSKFPPELVDPFIPYSHRWQKAALLLLNTKLSDLFANTSLALPNLETLMLRPSGKMQRITVNSAPNLHSTALVVSRGLRLDPRYLILPWPQMTHLSVTSLSGCIDDGYDILAVCPALTHCAFAAEASTVDLVTERPPLTLSCLTTLQLSTNKNPSLLLNSLITPVLRQLDVDFMDMGNEPNVWPKESITGLVTRSECHLKSLALRHKKVPEADILDLCRVIPSLVHLKVSGDDERMMELLRTRRSGASRIVSVSRSKKKNPVLRQSLSQ